ncbi:MAG: ABC transporter substrate-binding protein [Defluviitaleaceae bacterium]|nr:ABC transporter substrate-binding protein [Defluviitaleaceae bacterium]MCL2238967.1 ABC transporter substrate-binding protein [Defluviitaleaceae bacterium]
MLKKRSLITLLGLLLIMAMIFTACGGNNSTPVATPSPSPSPTAEATPSPTPAATPTPEEPAPARVRPDTDREGYAISLPDEINTIISIGPSNTEILVALGLSDRIIAADMFSADVVGIPDRISTELDMMGLDAEYIVNLMPDLVLITGMTRVGGDDPLAPVSAAGITVIYMPISVSIAAIMEDIRFIAAVMEANEAGEGIISTMQGSIDEIGQIAATIAETRTVYFEVSPAPWMFSFGTETFLNEMIELVGATNIFAGQVGWIPVTDEVLLEANPDVILTSTDFLDDPLGEIMERPGFNVITAVQNGDVFQIDANASNRPSHNIVIALRQIAEAVFPEYFR